MEPCMTDTNSALTLSRREAIRWGAAGTLGLGTASLLAACGGGGGATRSVSHPGASAGPPAGGSPARGGTLTIGWLSGGNAETLLPGHVLTNTDVWRVQQLFDPLFSVGPDTRPVPYLAEAAEPNSDATVWTVTIRSGITWHDGKSLTAEDVAAAIKSWTSQDNYYPGNAAAVIEIPKVRATGPLTVEVPLKVPVADFPGLTTNFAYYVTRPNAYAKGVRPIGTGPFKYQSFTPGKHSVFVANKDYWGVSGGPYVDQQVIDSSFTDDTARINALLSGTVDIAPALPPALAKANASSKQIYIGSASGGNSYYHQCRVDLAPFKDPRVMQALKLLCDRPRMVQSVFDGYAQQSNDLFPPGYHYYAGPDVFPVRQYDPERAKSLLKAAGHEDLRLTLYTSDVAAGIVEGGTLYAQQAAQGGVKVKVVKVDPSLYYTPQAPAGGYLKYPMFTTYAGSGSSVSSLTSYYLAEVWSKGSVNETHFGDAHTDKLMFDAIGELDSAKAEQKWNAIQKILYDRGGSITFGVGDYVDGYAKRVRGVKTTAAGWVNNSDVSKAWLTAS